MYVFVCHRKLVIESLLSKIGFAIDGTIDECAHVLIQNPFH